MSEQVEQKVVSATFDKAGAAIISLRLETVVPEIDKHFPYTCNSALEPLLSARLARGAMHYPRLIIDDRVSNLA